MPTYAITGVSKGIGFELLRQISANPENVVVGIVRDKTGTEKKVNAELGGRANIHILRGDLDDYASLKDAAANTAEIVGERGIDYLIANGGLASQFDAYDPIGTIAEKADEMEDVASKLFKTNVIGNIHLLNLFTPLVLKGKVKKVLALSSGHGDIDLINTVNIEASALYGASKAALNVVVAKFSAQYKKDGVLFLSMSPGVVDVGHFDNVTPEQMEGLKGFMESVSAYAPNFKGPVPVSEAIPIILATLDKVRIEDGFGGAFVSQFGNKQWF